MRRHLLSALRSCSGFSVVEVTTVLTAMTVLSTAAAPAIGDYVEEAKLIRVAQDTRTTGVGLVRLINDDMALVTSTGVSQ